MPISQSSRRWRSRGSEATAIIGSVAAGPAKNLTWGDPRIALIGLGTLWMAMFADVGAGLQVASNGLRLLQE